MAFMIANIIPQETINELNDIFDMDKFNLTIKRIRVRPFKLSRVDDFKFYDRLMKDDTEVDYPRNTY